MGVCRQLEAPSGSDCGCGYNCSRCLFIRVRIVFLWVVVKSSCISSFPHQAVRFHNLTYGGGAMTMQNVLISPPNLQPPLHPHPHPSQVRSIMLRERFTKFDDAGWHCSFFRLGLRKLHVVSSRDVIRLMAAGQKV